MNSKMIAVLAVAIMAVSGCVVTMSAQSDADAVDLGMVYVDTNPAEVELRFNETAYTQYDSYQIVLDAQVGMNSKANIYDQTKGNTADSTGNSVIVDGTYDLDLTVTKSSDGVYKIKIVNDETNKAPSGVYTIGFTLYVSATVGNTPIPLDPIGYTLDVNVRSFTEATFSAEGDMTAGVSGSLTLVGLLTYDSVNKYNSWYAVNLPDGLNVKLDGNDLKIVGMTEASEQEITCIGVVVIGRDDVGNEVHITVNEFTIAKSPKITYEINNATKVEGAADTYMVESGKTPAPTLTIKVDGVEFSSVTDGRQLIVSVIKDGSKRTDYQYTSGMTIPTNGVGKYVIEMTIGGSSVDGSEANGVSTNATIHVVPNITGAGAGFIVVGQP